MLEELRVLGGEDGVDQRLRHRLVRHGLGISPVVELRQDLTGLGVDPAHPAQVGEGQLHGPGVRDPLVGDPFERPIGRVGPEEGEQTDPSGEQQGDREQGGERAEPSAAPLPRFNLMDQGFAGHWKQDALSVREVPGM